MVSRCNTCGTHVSAKDNFVEFNCPSCGNEAIVRCKTCKNLGNRYICKSCKFVGP